MQQTLDIFLKAVFIYMLRVEVPKSNGTWEKRIQVVITSGVRDKVRQGMLFSSNCVYRNNNICFCWYTHKAICYFIYHEQFSVISLVGQGSPS